MSTVRFVGIGKKYGETVAVRDFYLDVADGEFVTLLGPSGCGKTTVLRITAGLVDPSAGRVFFDDEDVTFEAPRNRKVGFVFQTPALFPHMSVADNVGFGLSVARQKKAAVKARVDEMLAMVDLAGYGKRLPTELSGGQQQRVSLARVLATNPRVLLFDEPLSSLDKNLRDSLKYSIHALQRATRKSAIYVTHDQSEAFAISDRIVVMNRGRIEQIGSQTDIYFRPRTAFVAEFIGANNSLRGVVTAVRGELQSREVIVAAGDISLRCPANGSFAKGDDVVAYIRPEDITLLDEDAFEANENVVEGTISRLIFEGATAQLRIDVGGRELRVDVGGGQRLGLVQREGRVRIRFNHVTLIPAAISPIAEGQPEPRVGEV